MKTKIKMKIILTLLIISLLWKSVFADDQLDVKNNINYLRWGSIISWLFWDIFTKIFDTEWKLKVTFMSLLSLNDLSDVIVDDYNMYLWYMSWINNTWALNWNIGIWRVSLYSNTTWDSNTAIWVETLYENTEWYSNTAIWSVALAWNTTWYENTAVWEWALVWNDTWNGNSALWVNSLWENTTWDYNVSFWLDSLQNNSTWSYSTALWSESLVWCYQCEKNTWVWARSLYSNYTGSLNTAVWYASLHQTKWSWNVALGYQAGYNEIGSNKLYIDNSNTSSPLIHWDFATNKLTVNWSLKIGVATDTTCDWTNEWSIRYDSSGKHFYWCDWTSWLQLDN